MSQKDLSVVIICKNEAIRLERSLRSALLISDDIIVVDNGSTDGSREIAERLGARYIEHDWEGYSKQKNFGNQQAKHTYIFSLDADEVIPNELAQEINQLFEEGNVLPVYRISRLNHFCGKVIHHGNWSPDWQFRLFDKTVTAWNESLPVHEMLEIHPGTKVGTLTHKLYHFTTDSEEFYSEKMDHYAKLFAENAKKEGKRFSKLKAWVSPLFRFIIEFIFKLGFLDGIAGYKIARIHYMYTQKKYAYMQ